MAVFVPRHHTIRHWSSTRASSLFNYNWTNIFHLSVFHFLSLYNIFLFFIKILSEFSDDLIYFSDRNEVTLELSFYKYIINILYYVKSKKSSLSSSPSHLVWTIDCTEPDLRSHYRIKKFKSVPVILLKIFLFLKNSMNWCLSLQIILNQCKRGKVNHNTTDHEELEPEQVWFMVELIWLGFSMLYIDM